MSKGVEWLFELPIREIRPRGPFLIALYSYFDETERAVKILFFPRDRVVAPKSFISLLGVSLIVLSVLSFSGCKTPEGQTGDEQRASIRKNGKDILAKVYSAYGEARSQVDDSVGYATFSTINAKILFGGTGNGYGILTEKPSGKQTFIRMARIQVGFGLGVQELSVLLIFKSKEKLAEFKQEGWTFGGGASAAMVSEAASPDDPTVDKSMQATVDGDPLVYQVTDAGVNLSATLEGVKFWRDAALN
jgi:lipid-binding SYLF domain-containing protein